MNPYCFTVLAQVAAEADVPRVMKMPSEMDVSGTMSLLTWVTFLVATVILYRIAWKPILIALDKREKSIAQALKDAETSRQQTAAAEEQRKQMLEEAGNQAKDLLDSARKAAEDASASIQQKAREEARNLLSGADLEIKLATEKALSTLRRESAELAVDLAGKMMRESIPDDRKRQLSDKLLKEL
ncbi:MAG: F0F1 ATP synthase subunit B [Lentisphaerota bacterium]